MEKDPKLHSAGVASGLSIEAIPISTVPLPSTASSDSVLILELISTSFWQLKNREIKRKKEKGNFSSV